MLAQQRTIELGEAYEADRVGAEIIAKLLGGDFVDLDQKLRCVRKVSEKRRRAERASDCNLHQRQVAHDGQIGAEYAFAARKRAPLGAARFRQQEIDGGGHQRAKAGKQKEQRSPAERYRDPASRKRRHDRRQAHNQQHAGEKLRGRARVIKIEKHRAGNHRRRTAPDRLQ